VSSVEEWRRRVRRNQAARLAAQRRHPASRDRVQPDQLADPDYRQMRADQLARHRLVDALLAQTRTRQPGRHTFLEFAARAFEQQSGDPEDDDQ
jgi:hypothetical protein